MDILKIMFFIFNLHYNAAFPEDYIPFPKPEAVPQTACWLGGYDGGNWLNIDSIVQKNNNMYLYAQVYSGYYGESLASGKFKLSCEDSLFDFDEKNVESVLNFYQEGKIFTLAVNQDGRYCAFILEENN